MSATRAQAVNEMAKLFTDYWGVDNVSLPGKSFDTPTNNSQKWCKVRFEHTNGEQYSLATNNGKRRWKRAGLGTIEIYFPIDGDVSAADTQAEAIEQLYQGKRTASDVWFRNVRTIEDFRFDTWYKLDVVFEFEYDTIV